MVQAQTADPNDAAPNKKRANRAPSTKNRNWPPNVEPKNGALSVNWLMETPNSKRTKGLADNAKGTLSQAVLFPHPLRVNFSFDAFKL